MRDAEKIAEMVLIQSRGWDITLVDVLEDLDTIDKGVTKQKTERRKYLRSKICTIQDEISNLRTRMESITQAYRDLSEKLKVD